MENVLPRFERPLKSTSEPEVNNDYWDKAVDAFDEKEYRTSILSVINYLNEKVLEGVDTSSDINITQMQGSAEINIKITDDSFSIKVPFLKITEKTNEVALLRKVAEVNFSQLDIEQIKLKDKELFFSYECPLSMCQPNKMFSLIRNVCFRSDELDDEFIENYGAEFYKEPKTTKLTQEEQEIAWKQISNIFEDYEGLHDLFREKRWNDWQWDAILISLLKLSNMPYLQGLLRSELIENIEALYNNKVDFQTRVDRGTNYIKTLIAKDKSEFIDSLYHADQFVSLLWRSSEEIIEEKCENIQETVDDYEENEKHFNQSYYLQGIFLKMLYNYNLEDSYKNAIYKTLEEVSGLSPDEAAPKLHKLYDDMNHCRINDEDEDDGIEMSELMSEAKKTISEVEGIMSKLIYKSAASLVFAIATSYAAYKYLF